ncbi:MAG: GAF domain-containing protein [Candidatus Sulfotelmatobacter sp.]
MAACAALRAASGILGTPAPMDHYSILNHGSPASAEASTRPSNGKAELPGNGGGSAAHASVSARITAANAMHPAKLGSETSSGSSSTAKMGFPGEDGGRSLAAMAERDLDAALQLLAERAQYITGASGAAIALRRGVAHDMLCRASAGSNAPELGALLSTEYGLSGESVRTRRALRCDDAERDPRVNRDGCRQLGIASVVIMPIVGDEEVIGVFELFSGKANAFNERDLAALGRLGTMVETAVNHAVASQESPEVTARLQIDIQPPADKTQPKARAAAASAAPPSAPAKESDKDADGKKPLFWSAAVRAQSVHLPASEAKPLAIPPVLRQLQKCQACGFPVSPGRTFCVECEGKHWRGERAPQPAAQATPLPAIARDMSYSTKPASGVASSPGNAEHHEGAVPVAIAEVPGEVCELEDAASKEPASLQEVHGADNREPQAGDAASSEIPALFLGSALESESWFAAHKYIVGAIVLIAITIAAMVWLR